MGRPYNWSTGDDSILSAAAADGSTFLAYDISTIAPLVKEWNESGRRHAGIVFVTARTIAQNDIGGLVHALVQIWDESGEDDWTGRTAFLRGVR